MELAEKLGYDSPQFVSLFERGFSKVPVDTLGQLISILGIPEKVVLGLLLSDYESEIKTKMAEGKRKA